MLEIQTDQVLALKNVISYRANMNQLEINTCMNEIGKLIQQSNATVNGFVTMATFAVNQNSTALQGCRIFFMPDFNSISQ